MKDDVEVIMDADRFIVGVGLKVLGEKVMVDSVTADQLILGKHAHRVPAKSAVKHSED